MESTAFEFESNSISIARKMIGCGVVGLTSFAAHGIDNPWEFGAKIAAGSFIAMYVITANSLRDIDRSAVIGATKGAALLGLFMGGCNYFSQPMIKHNEQQQMTMRALPVLTENAPISQAELCASAPVRNGYVALKTVKARVACPAAPQ